MHRIPLWKNATRDGCIHQTGSPSTSFTRLPTRRSRVSPFSLNNCIIRSGSSIHSSSAPISSIVSSNKSQNLPSFSFFHEQDSESTKNTRDSLQQLDEINDSWSVLSTGDLNVEIESLEEKTNLTTDSLPAPTLQSLYEALSEPIGLNSIQSGKDGTSASSSKIPSHFLESIKLSISPSDLNNNAISNSESYLPTSPHPTLSDINKAIWMNAQTNRPEEAQRAFDLISQNNLTPDYSSYLLLMKAYAQSRDLPKVAQIFRDLKRSKLVINEYAYGIFINTCVQANQLDIAYRLYDQMKAQPNVQPTQAIFATLIQGCLKAKDFDRGWKTFDYMRTEICEPDVITYNIILNLCATTGHVERAFNLFTEMTERRNILPTKVTFYTLLKACANRKDYYQETFQVLERMIKSGYVPTRETFHVLMNSVVKNGDSERLTILWNDLMTRAIEDSLERYKPNDGSFLRLLQGLSTALAKRVKTGKTEGEGNAEVSEKHVTDSIQVEAALEPIETENPLLLSTDLIESPRPKVIMDEAMRIWSILETPAESASPAFAAQFRNTQTSLTSHIKDEQSSLIPISTPLVDAYLSIFSRLKSRFTLEKCMEIYRETYQRHGIEKSSTTHTLILRRVAKDKTAMEEYGAVVWKDLQEWDQACEEALKGLTETEKEERRARQGRGKDAWKSWYQTLISGYTRLDNIPRALEILQEAQSFRYPTYLPDFHFRDVTQLVNKCLDAKDDGNWEFYTALIKALPTPPEQSFNNLDIVQDLLKKRRGVVSRKWWGWDSMQLKPEQVLEQVRRRRKMQKDRERVKRVMNEDLRGATSKLQV